MKITRTIQVALLTAALSGGVTLVAQQVSADRHPHLAAAQHHGQEAFRELTEAQRANNGDMGGHAQKAKELLEQANHELELAVQEANAHDRH
jgi:hypothetical protein